MLYNNFNVKFNIKRMQPGQYLVDNLPFHFLKIMSLIVGVIACIFVIVILIMLMVYNVQISFIEDASALAYQRNQRLLQQM